MQGADGGSRVTVVWAESRVGFWTGSLWAVSLSCLCERPLKSLELSSLRLQPGDPQTPSLAPNPEEPSEIYSVSWSGP